MSKKLALILLVPISILTSFVAFYTTNLVLTDIGNNTISGIQNADIVSSIPGLMVAFSLVTILIFILRMVKDSQYKKSLVKLYSLIILGFAVVGLIFTILSVPVMYGTLLAPYPFPGYLMICLIVHILSIIGMIFVRFFLTKKIQDDQEKRKITVKYVLQSMLLAFFMWFSMDRVGAVIWSSAYVEFRTIGLTIFFYLYCFSTLLIMVFYLFYCFGILENHKKAAKIYVLTSVGLTLIFAVITLILTFTNPLFVASVSPAIGLERLANMPVVTLIQTIIFVAMGIYELVKVFKKAE